MKRSHILFVTAGILCLASCNSGKFNIQADMETAGFRQAESVQIQSEALDKPLTADIQNGHFSVSGKVKGSSFATLSLLGGPTRQGYPFILEHGNIVFTEKHAVGTPLNDSTAAFVQGLQTLAASLKDQPEQLRPAVHDRIKAYVQRHAKDPSGVYAVKFADGKVTPEEMQELIGLLSRDQRNEGVIRTISKNLKRGAEK